MGRRRTFLLLLVLCVFASFVSAQTATVEFLDEWGETTSRVLEQSRVLLRVIDPAADTTSGRDSVSVGLSAVNGPDTATVALEETAGDTGVFEGEAFLTTDYALDNIYGVDADQLYTAWAYNPDPTLDTATATYGGASDSVEVGLSEARFVDAEGRGTSFVVAGAPVHVRVRDVYEDIGAGPDFTTATLTTSDGDSEAVTLTETGARTRAYLGSLPVVLGTPVPGDGRIQSAHGAAITVTHAEPATGTTASSDTATVVGALVSFLRTRDGRTAGALLADSPIGMRLIDVSLNLDPAAVETRGVSVTMLTASDPEYSVLRETGPDTGVFEGTIQHVTTTSQTPANGFLESPAGPDTVRLQHEAVYYASTEAPLIVSTTRLVDEAGGDAESVALGTGLRFEVENAMDTGPHLDVWDVQVRSLATNDQETLQVAETDGRSYLFTGAIPVVPGAAVSGDGRLQAQPGETVEAVTDVGGATSSDQAAVVRSSVRFVDESGEPRTVLLEESDARVRVLDPLSAGQAPPAATIRSRIPRDVEPLGLAELPGSPGLFEGSIPMKLWGWGSGILTTGREFHEADTITAGDGQSSASLLLVPAVVEVLNGPAAVAGDTLSLRVTAPRADESSEPEYLMVLVSSREYGHSQYVFLPETGGSTGIFEGTVPAVRPGDPGPAPLVYVEARDTVEVAYNAATFFGDSTGRATGIVDIVPVSVRLVDDQGEAAAGYLLGDYVRVRVDEPDANADPDTAESVEAVVSARRYGDAKVDVETATLVETGPDTGVFLGSLSTAVLAGLNDLPVPYNAVLEFPDYLAAPDNVSTVTAARGGASATARVRDSEIRLLDDQGEDAGSFEVGETFQVRMRRPLGNITPGVDTATVGVEARVDTGYRDSLMLTLTETGGDTGVFTATVATAAPPVDFLDSVVQAVPGDVLFVQRSNYVLYSFDTAVFTGEGGGEPLNRQPDAVDDAVSTQADTPVVIPVAANDSDPDGDAIEVFYISQPANGTAVLNADGTVTYTPASGFTGYDAFMYVIRDGPEGSDYLTDTGTVYVTINAVNGPPDAVDDSATTNEDVPVYIAVKANDSDPDGDPLTVASVTQGTNGAVGIHLDGTVQYWPDLDFHGTDTFTYTLSDGWGHSDTAVVTVTVNAVNDPPVAFNDSVTTNEDTSVNFPVMGNDSDPDGDTLSVIAVTQGAKGSVVINQSPGAFHWLIYTPNANANGTDSFTYTISDGTGGGGGTDTATVTVTITPVNDVPRAFADQVTTAEDTPITFDPRTNDTDPDGDPLTITFAGDPNRGSAVVNAGSTITYTPDPNLNGADSVFYTISDGNGGTWSATVSVTVTPVNDVPNANNDLPLVTEDTPLAIAVLANDSDPDGNVLSVTAYTQPAKGTAVLNADKTITYSPNLNATGTDSFTYTISDGVEGGGGTDTATVNVSIIPVNDPPVAVTDTATVAEEGTVTISVLANDTDPENSTLTLVSVTQAAHGTVTLLAGNQVRYQPAANYFGPDTFTYTVRDPGNLTATGTVNVTVTNVNDPPVAVADSAATNEDTPVTVSVLANDTDVDGDTLSVVSVTQSANGSVVTNGTTVTFTPAANWSGVATFTYTARDAGGVDRTANVTVTVNPVNDPPLAGPDMTATKEGTPVTVSVLANDADIDGGALSVSAVTQGSGGTAATDGVTATYTPGANFTGTDTFSYTVSDGLGGTASGQVTVVVGEALERVAILATNSVWLRSGSDVLSGDVIVNQAGAGPFLNGAELSVGGSVTTAANWDVEADSLTVAAGAVVGSDVSYNQLTNNGTINGLQRTPLALPVFSALPAFLTATPGSTNVNVPNNGTTTLAPGSYQDLVVGRKGTVNFTGGVYHFRSITVDREAKLLFQAAAVVRVQQKLGTKNLTTVGPAAGASIDASSIVFHVAGINGTSGALGATPKAVEIGANNTLAMNLYSPNGTIWLQDGTTATGAFLGKDVDVGLNVQVTLDSAF